MRTLLTTKTTLRLSPQMVLAGRLLRVSGEELSNLLSKELAENPALEVDEHRITEFSFPISPNSLPNRVNLWHESSSSPRSRWSEMWMDDPFENITERSSPLNQLISLARLLVDRADVEPITALIQSLDEHGYLRPSARELADKLGYPVDMINRLTAVLHELEPPGIGARDLRECLLLQCKYLLATGRDCENVILILESGWQEFTGQEWRRLARRLHLSSDTIDAVRRFIVDFLYPYPFALIDQPSADQAGLHTPDMIIRAVPGKPASYRLEIPAAEIYSLHVNPTFEAIIRDQAEAKLTPQEESWIQGQLERTRMFISSFEQRWITLRRIGEYLIQFQHEYLEKGPLWMKPLTQGQVARDLNCHGSTISRAVQDKVVQLPNGRLVPMDRFFDSALACKQAIRNMLAVSEQPLCDREIAERLRAQGMIVARRTVAKYRAQSILTGNYL